MRLFLFPLSSSERSILITSSLARTRVRFVNRYGHLYTLWIRCINTSSNTCVNACFSPSPMHRSFFIPFSPLTVISFKCLQYDLITSIPSFLALSRLSQATFLNFDPLAEERRDAITHEAERKEERKRGRTRKSLERVVGQAARLLGRIMRTNANSRSLRCGQAFICHALAAVYSRGQYGTYANRRLRTSYLTSNSSSSSGHLRAIVPFPPRANPIPSSRLLPPSNFRAT